MAKNKGYTLVELIIVIAIMVILAAASLGSVVIIKKAKFSEAVSTLNNQISSSLVRTKATSSVQNRQQCMVILDRGDGSGTTQYVIMTGYLNGSVLEYSNGTPITSTGYLGTSADPRWDEKCEAVLPKEVAQIYYSTTAPSGTTPSGTLVSSPEYIQFVKSDGSVNHGAGYYTLVARSGNTATIYLDADSGKHYIQ